jgi:hypothetical protein
MSMINCTIFCPKGGWHTCTWSQLHEAGVVDGRTQGLGRDETKNPGCPSKVSRGCQVFVWANNLRVKRLCVHFLLPLDEGVVLGADIVPVAPRNFHSVRLGRLIQHVLEILLAVFKLAKSMDLGDSVLSLVRFQPPFLVAIPAARGTLISGNTCPVCVAEGCHVQNSRLR